MGFIDVENARTQVISHIYAGTQTTEKKTRNPKWMWFYGHQ